jgi:hypothetical protein
MGLVYFLLTFLVIGIIAFIMSRNYFNHQQA